MPIFFSRILRFAFIVCAIACAVASVAAQKRDNLTNEEDLIVREAQEIDLRMRVFGKVVEGSDVLDKLQRIDPNRPSFGVQPDTIIRGYVVEK